jgi:hypothetical protein
LEDRYFPLGPILGGGDKEEEKIDHVKGKIKKYKEKVNSNYCTNGKNKKRKNAWVVNTVYNGSGKNYEEKGRISNKNQDPIFLKLARRTSLFLLARSRYSSMTFIGQKRTNVKHYFYLVSVILLIELHWLDFS